MTILRNEKLDEVFERFWAAGYGSHAFVDPWYPAEFQKWLNRKYTALVDSMPVKVTSPP